MEKDVMQLFGGTVALQNNIVSMMTNFLGGDNAANGSLENVFQNGIPHHPMPHPPLTYHSSQVLKSHFEYAIGSFTVHISHNRFLFLSICPIIQITIMARMR